MEPTSRFTDRADLYAKYRPSYPTAALDCLYGEAGIRPSSRIAEIGAGTGIFTRLLLERGSAVTAVEPNAAMRERLAEALGAEPKLEIASGTAEATALPDRVFDAVVCAQAFHWFDREAAKREFRRIMRTDGVAALVWNTRRTTGHPFLERFERLLLTYGTDYAKVNHRNVTRDELKRFFREGTMRAETFEYRLAHDYDALRGRVLSSSYCPAPGQPNYEPMMAELRALFDAFESDGVVPFEYETEVYWGLL